MKYLSLLLVLIANMAHSNVAIELSHAFVLDEVEWVKEQGSATVAGSAYIKLENGEYRGCAGFNVELLPAAPYANERILHTYQNNKSGQILMSQNPPKFSPDVAEYHDYLLKTKCGENNQFEFSAVPAGEYYAIAFIIFGEAPKLQGGGVMQKIVVKDGATTTVLIKQ